MKIWVAFTRDFPMKNVSERAPFYLFPDRPTEKDGSRPFSSLAQAEILRRGSWKTWALRKTFPSVFVRGGPEPPAKSLSSLTPRSYRARRSPCSSPLTRDRSSRAGRPGDEPRSGSPPASTSGTPSPERRRRQSLRRCTETDTRGTWPTHQLAPSSRWRRSRG